jgi:hypothetical protein
MSDWLFWPLSLFLVESVTIEWVKRHGWEVALAATSLIHAVRVAVEIILSAAGTKVTVCLMRKLNSLCLWLAGLAGEVMAPLLANLFGSVTIIIFMAIWLTFASAKHSLAYTRPFKYWWESRTKAIEKWLQQWHAAAFLVVGIIPFVSGIGSATAGIAFASGKARTHMLAVSYLCLVTGAVMRQFIIIVIYFIQQKT